MSISWPPKPPVPVAIAGDLRLQTGSYIEDGEHMFRVLGRHTAPQQGLSPAREVLDCENCATLYPVPLELIDCKRDWRLVRAEPPPTPARGWALGTGDPA
jgi:hypothetical protein